MAARLDNPSQAISALSYFDCIDVVVEKSLVLGDSGNQIKTTSRNGDFDQFGIAVESTALAVCQLTEATAQAAYLVGVADAGSEEGIPGLVDQTQFVQAQQAITLACQNLLSPTSTQEQVRFCFFSFLQQEFNFPFIQCCINVCVCVCVRVCRCCLQPQL